MSDEVVQESESRAGKLKLCRKVKVVQESWVVVAFSTAIASQSRWRVETNVPRYNSYFQSEYALSHTARGGKLKNEKSRIKWTKILEPKNEKTKRGDHLRYPTPKRVKYDVFYRA